MRVPNVEKVGVSKMYGFNKKFKESLQISTDQYVKYTKMKQLENFHKIVNRDCYGYKKGGDQKNVE